MKTPDTAKTVSSATRQGAQILPFTFPARTNTACSEILARLLSGEVLTGMDGVFEVSTTRLAAHVHYLAESYGVPTEANDRAVGCNDGRVVTVKAYSLPHSVIQSARAAGAAPWIPGYIEPGPRTGERVAHWDALALDVEGKAERLPDGSKRLTGPKAPTLSEMAAELELWGLAAVLHTTHTHEEPAADGDTLGPRYRVVLNPSRPILPTEIKPLGLAVVAMLGLSDCTDTKCLEPARLFFWPRCPEERAHLAQSAVLDGEVLDVDAILTQAKRSAEPPPRKPGPTGASVIAAFNAQADIAHLLEQAGYVPKGRNRWMWQGSTSGLAGVVLLPDTGRVYSHHPGDPLHSDHSHDAFSVWCILNHAGNFTAAVKAAARLLGMERTRAEPVDFSALMNEATSASTATAPEQKTPHPLALFVDLDEEPRAPRWVIPGFIGHGVTVIAGAHGVGKTTTLLPLAMLAAGLHVAGDPIAPQHWRHVVYIVEEREQAERIVSGLVRYGGLGLDWATVRERLHIVEARRLQPDYVAQVGSLYRERFTREAAGVQVLPLVVIDTMAATLELDSENDNSEASAAMAALKQGFDGLPVWLVGHLSKSNLGRSEAQGMTLRGAGAFEADANQVLYLVKEGETRFLVRGKTRFEARWPELEVSSHFTDVVAKNEFGALEAAGFAPDVVSMNPADWLAITVAKGTANDHYLSGNYLGGMPSEMRGLRVVLSPAVTAGKALLMDSAHSELLLSDGFSVEIAYSGDDFTKNLSTVLGELRVIPTFRTAGSMRLITPKA